MGIDTHHVLKRLLDRDQELTKEPGEHKQRMLVGDAAASIMELQRHNAALIREAQSDIVKMSNLRQALDEARELLTPEIRAIAIEWQRQTSEEGLAAEVSDQLVKEELPLMAVVHIVAAGSDTLRSDASTLVSLLANSKCRAPTNPQRILEKAAAIMAIELGRRRRAEAATAAVTSPATP